MKLSLLPIPQNHPVEENFRRLKWFLETVGGATSLEGLALMLGGALLRASITAGQDAEIPHPLTRIPSMVVLSSDDSGLGGVAYGAPSGQNGALGGNEAAWTSSNVYLRASRTSTYQVIIV